MSYLGYMNDIFQFAPKGHQTMYQLDAYLVTSKEKLKCLTTTQLCGSFVHETRSNRNLCTPDSEYRTAPHLSTVQQLSIQWSHFSDLSIEPKVSKQ